MANSTPKLPLSTRTLQFGSSFAAGAMMLSRMNRSEISRYDDLVSDLCCLRTPSPSVTERRSEQALAPRKRWMRWTLSRG